MRWRIVLPVSMTVLSAYLMIVAKRQQYMLWKRGTGWEVPARVLNAVIGGPGFYFGRLVPIPMPSALNAALSYDGDRILGIALFWFLIGLSIDRHMSKHALDTRHPTGASLLFTLATLICGFLGFGGIAYVSAPAQTSLAGSKAQEWRGRCLGS